MASLLLLFVSALAATYGGMAEWLLNSENHADFVIFIDCVSILNLILLAGLIATLLNQASARTAQTKPIDWLPGVTALLFGSIVALMNFGAYVPVLLGAVMMCPLFLLPPLMYRVMEPEPAPKPKLFTIEETCKTQDKVYMSKMIKDFRDRYPQSNAYMYRSNQNYTAGGILLHSKEAVPEVTDTFIEVTLNCPFTLKFGNFAEGKEIFFAYLSRHLKTGSIVSSLPQKNWQTWLEGLTDSEWFERIEALDSMEPTHPCLDDNPCQFTDLSIKWEPFVWT